VLTYTSPPLPRDTTYVGPLSAQLHLSPSVRHTDVHVTLCDVSPRGRSTNVSSGILRLRDVQAGAGFPVTVEMWPIGCTFRAGHRLSVHVSSGAHPTYARNPGTDEASAGAITLAAADQQLFHDPDRASRLVIGGVAL
jgi:putative CocE/NonD family hydrolase